MGHVGIVAIGRQLLGIDLVSEFRAVRSRTVRHGRFGRRDFRAPGDRAAAVIGGHAVHRGHGRGPARPPLRLRRLNSRSRVSCRGRGMVGRGGICHSGGWITAVAVEPGPLATPGACSSLAWCGGDPALRGAWAPGSRPGHSSAGAWIQGFLIRQLHSSSSGTVGVWISVIIWVIVWNSVVKRERGGVDSARQRKLPESGCAGVNCSSLIHGCASVAHLITRDTRDWGATKSNRKTNACLARGLGRRLGYEPEYHRTIDHVSTKNLCVKCAFRNSDA